MTTKKIPKKLSLKERIRRGPATEAVSVWIGADMGLVREYETAAAKLAEEKSEDDSLAGPDVDEPTITARMAEIRDELADYEETFRVRAIDPKRWNRLLEQHPPRMLGDGAPDPRDRSGWNSETFPSALIRYATVSPEFDADDWLVLLGDDEQEATLTGGQIDRLSATVLRLSQWHIDIPFAHAASQPSPSSASE